MSNKKNIVLLILSSVILAILLFLLFDELYLSKSLIVIIGISLALVIDAVFFVRTFLQITSEYKGPN